MMSRMKNMKVERGRRKTIKRNEGIGRHIGRQPVEQKQEQRHRYIRINKTKKQ